MLKHWTCDSTYAPEPAKTVPSQLLSVFSVDPLIQVLPVEELTMATPKVPQVPEVSFEAPAWNFNVLSPQLFSMLR